MPGGGVHDVGHGGAVVVEDLPTRTPGASGYQRFMVGDLADELLRRPVYEPPGGYMDVDDPEAWKHVAAVLDRPHVKEPRGQHVDS